MWLSPFYKACEACETNVSWLRTHTESPKIWDLDLGQVNAKDIYSISILPE